MIDAVVARGDGRLELVGDLAYPLPAIVISEMAGFPVEDKRPLPRLDVADQPVLLPQRLCRSRHTATTPTRAILEARGWIHPLLEERRRAPHDDLLGALVAADYEGGRLSEAELLSTAITLFLGGHETTTGSSRSA